MNKFFKAGMGTRISKGTWRYKRQEMGQFIRKYGSISIPAYDLERIIAEESIRRILVEEKSSGDKYYLPIEYLASGTHHTMPKWAEPNQYFIPIHFWDWKMGG